VDSNWRDLSDDEKAAYLRQLRAITAPHKKRPWRDTARYKQLPPDDPQHHLPDSNGYRCQDPRCLRGEVDTSWRIFLMLGGRGSGKTFSGSNWILENAMRYPDTKWGVFSPTANELMQVVFGEESGLERQALEGDIAELRPGVLDINQNQHRIRLSNGSTIQGYSLDAFERIRGANLHGAWIDELASARYAEDAWQVLVPAVRRGKARMMITTTPRSTPLIRQLVARDDVHVTVSRMTENAHLPEDYKAAVLREFGGTRMGRQELDGELLSDFEGSLFRRADLDRVRIRPDDMPLFSRVVVGFDPAMRGGETHDESGIVVVGEVPSDDGSGHAYVIDDKSFRGSPNEVAKAVSDVYDRWQADSVVVETNQGGEWVTNLLRSVNPGMRIRTVTARRNKFIRAEPVGALAEQGRLHMVGNWLDLEDQLACMIPGEMPARSPDRADAMVWAVYELKQLSQPSYLSAYGLRSCVACGTAFRKDGGECPECSEPAEVIPEPAPPENPREQVWSRAYMKSCAQGHWFAKASRSCPECVQSPDEFMRRVERFSGMGSEFVAGASLAKFWTRGGYRPDKPVRAA